MKLCNINRIRYPFLRHSADTHVIWNQNASAPRQCNTDRTCAV